MHFSAIFTKNDIKKRINTSLYLGLNLMHFSAIFIFWLTHNRYL